MRTWFRWIVLVVFASLSLTSVAFAVDEQTTAAKKQPTHPSKNSSAAKAKALKALAAIPAPKPHRILIQVDQNDPAVMNLALNNATNLIDYYRAKHLDIKIDLVTYGPGLHMLRDDTSPVKDRIKQLKDYAFPSTIQFSACNNTKENMEKKEGKPITLVSEAIAVPAGVVHLTELQEKGWTYLKP
jgi:intracellular sulfur oxidation DsrE/DsrF family protein